MTIPKKALERLVAGFNEYDTVVIVTDVLAEIFGYDKYSDHLDAQRRTVCASPWAHHLYPMRTSARSGQERISLLITKDDRNALRNWTSKSGQD